MDTLVIVVVLGSAMLHAVWNAIIKGGADKLIEASMKATGGGIAVLAVLPFLQTPPPECWPYLAGTICIHFFYYLFIAYAYRGADLSYAYTIMRGSSPLFTALVSVFILSETLSAVGWTGVLMLSAGVLILAVDCIRWGGFSLSSTILAMANAFVIMGYTLVDGHGVRFAETAVSYTCWVFFCNAFPITIFTMVMRRKIYARYIIKRWKYGLLGGICSLFAYGFALWGMTRAPIATVAALRETSVVFGMLFAVLFLKEKVTPERIAGVILVLAGATIMRQ
jgi:drug/metabolite transporter (DMT)-like permease